jgi:hypothetical protein
VVLLDLELVELPHAKRVLVHFCFQLNRLSLFNLVAKTG